MSMEDHQQTRRKIDLVLNQLNNIEKKQKEQDKILNSILEQSKMHEQSLKNAVRSIESTITLHS